MKSFLLNLPFLLMLVLCVSAPLYFFLKSPGRNVQLEQLVQQLELKANREAQRYQQCLATVEEQKAAHAGDPDSLKLIAEAEDKYHRRAAHFAVEIPKKRRTYEDELVLLGQAPPQQSVQYRASMNILRPALHRRAKQPSPAD